MASRSSLPFSSVPPSFLTMASFPLLPHPPSLRRKFLPSKSRISARSLLLSSVFFCFACLIFISFNLFRQIVARQHHFRPRESAKESAALFVGVDVHSNAQLEHGSSTVWRLRAAEEHFNAADRNSSIAGLQDGVSVAQFSEDSAILSSTQNGRSGSTQEEESLGSSQLLSAAADLKDAVHQEREPNSNADKTVSAIGTAVSETLCEPYHNEALFKEHYKEMKLKLKIFVYPHSHSDPYSNIFLPVDNEPGGNYASESSFKKALMSSSFITKNASEANLFYLPFSITRLRHDKHVGVAGLTTFISSYVTRIRQKWPYWNRTAGADHFFVSCHSITKLVSDNVAYLRTNAIQVVCSSNSFMQGYTPHKDVSLPQVWVRKGTPPEANLVKQRKVLAFFAGAANSPVRAAVVKEWSRDTDILVYSDRLSASYSKALLTSKFCLHIKGFEVNTARVADAMHFGCVPVILANYYDLPYADVLKWEHFSLVVSTSDIPLLKKILEGVTTETYEILQKNVMKVRKHFQWNNPPVDHDAFYLVMYELWSERRVLRAATF